MYTAIVLLSTFLVAVAAWWLFKDLVLSSPLDNVPGPPSPSLLTGEYDVNC